MPVVVVSDSSSRLHPDELARWDIRQVPLHVLIDGEDLRDGSDEIPFDVHARPKVTTAGSATRLDHVASGSAPIARHLIEDSGGILVGKLKTVEFARGGYGTNQHMGTPVNPWTYPDEYSHLVPGGSSSGSGVSVASFQVPCAVGTDTGGSVRYVRTETPLSAADPRRNEGGGTLDAARPLPSAARTRAQSDRTLFVTIAPLLRRRSTSRHTRGAADCPRPSAAPSASRPRRTCCPRTVSFRSRIPSIRQAHWRGAPGTARSCAAR